MGSKDIKIEGYWQCYGGLKAQLASPYFWFSFTLAVFVVCFRQYRGLLDRDVWCDITFSVVPCILVFSMGCYAVFLLMFNNVIFEKLMVSSNRGTVSSYRAFSASFTHWIIIQLESIAFAAIYRIASGSIQGWTVWQDCIRGFGCFLLIYSVCTGVAAVKSLYALAATYEVFLERSNEEEK